MTAAATPVRAFIDPAQTIPDLQAVIEDAMVNDPRSLQTTLGPSEIGCACDRCLITMLTAQASGVKAPEDFAAWLPTLGRAVHEWLEWTVLNHLAVSGSDRYLVEGRVAVGTVGGVEIFGNSDVFDTHTGTVVDYKITGTTTLRSCKKAGAKTTYRNQIQTYGKGWEDAGYDVRSVAAWYLPRNGFTVGAGYLHQEPYDRQIALDVLARADMFASAVAAFGSDAVLAAAGPHTGTEFSCPSTKPTPTAEGFLMGTSEV